MATVRSATMTLAQPGTLLTASTSNQEPANRAGNLPGHPESEARELEGQHRTPLGHFDAFTRGQSGTSHDVQRTAHDSKAATCPIRWTSLCCQKVFKWLSEQREPAEREADPAFCGLVMLWGAGGEEKACDLHHLPGLLLLCLKGQQPGLRGKSIQV